MSDFEEIFLPPKCCAQLQKQIKDLEANLKSQCEGNIELGRQVAMLESQGEWVSVSLGDLYASDCWCGDRAHKGISRQRGPEGCLDAVTRGRTFCEKHWKSFPTPPETGND